MMESAPDRLSPSLWLWHRYDPAVKAQLFSTAVKTADGVFLVDPIPLPDAALDSALEGEKVSGIVVTNANHARAAADFAVRLVVPVFARSESKSELGGCAIDELSDGQKLASDFVAIAIDGAAPGEIALHHSGEDGSLILGDALVNMDAHGFIFLPAKYCENPKLMRRSLRKLLDYPFARMLFAHGTPIVSQARSRLTTLLESNS